MYHRIDHVDSDPWELTVSPENFEDQLQVLTKRYRVVPVNELSAQLGKGAIRHKSICLTFDDGYRDNYLYAKPLLESTSALRYFIFHLNSSARNSDFGGMNYRHSCFTRENCPPFYRL
jgi:hypothetical protein